MAAAAKTDTRGMGRYHEMVGGNACWVVGCNRYEVVVHGDWDNYAFYLHN